MGDIYVRRDDKVQACGNISVQEQGRCGGYYLGGMCLCPPDCNCPNGNENKLWLNNENEVEKHLEQCAKMLLGDD